MYSILIKSKYAAIASFAVNAVRMDNNVSATNEAVAESQEHKYKLGDCVVYIGTKGCISGEVFLPRKPKCKYCKYEYTKGEFSHICKHYGGQKVYYFKYSKWPNMDKEHFMYVKEGKMEMEIDPEKMEIQELHVTIPMEKSNDYKIQIAQQLSKLKTTN